jgi:hypothetical protein
MQLRITVSDDFVLWRGDETWNDVYWFLFEFTSEVASSLAPKT